MKHFLNNMFGDSESEKISQRLKTKLDDFCIYQKQIRSNLIHDIRNPLMNIKLASEMQKKIFRKLANENMEAVSMNEKFFKYSDIIFQEITQINHYIDDILEFERNFHDDLKVNFSRQNLKKDLNIIFQKFMSIYNDEKRSFEYRYLLPEEELIYDREKLERIVNNLLSNAVKYTEAGKIELIADQKEDQVSISVIDNGCGIPEDKIQDIFNRFNQVNNENQQYGNGIGLDIIKHLAFIHCGTVHVSSQENQGSLFEFCFPLNLAESKNIANQNISETAL